MFGFNKSVKLKRQQVRLLAEIKFLDRVNQQSNSLPQYYVDKMLDAAVELADVEYQIRLLENHEQTT